MTGRTRVELASLPVYKVEARELVACPFQRRIFQAEESEGTEGLSSGETTPASSGDQKEMMSREDVSTWAAQGSGFPPSETRAGRRVAQA